MEVAVSEAVRNAMAEALALALSARGQTSPNPMVGAVVLNSQSQIVGRGFHPKAGEFHAEVFAVKNARENKVDLASSSLVVTLEPCNHFGRTPPCAQLILDSGIKTVYVGALDPNPLMQGRSIQKLKAAGVQVFTGVLQKECETLIRGFRSVMTKKRPYITVKCATSLDGKIATSDGESKWITDEPARLEAHHERHQHDTILVGIGTVLADDPRLDVRLPGIQPRPLRKVILDSQLKTPPTAKVLQSAGPVFIYCDWNFPATRRKVLEEAGATVVPLEQDQSGQAAELSVKFIVEDLARRGTQELLVEGGAKVLGAFVRERLFDRLLYFVAPKILGSTSRDVFDGLDVKRLQDSVLLENLSTRLVGKDILIEGTSIQKEESCSQV